MRFILAAVLLSIATSAVAQTSMPATCFAKIPALAAKLGVPPHDPSYATTLSIAGCNGKTYDLILMLSALVDKMDRAAKK